MKNSFEHSIKHLECKLYINPKTHNYNINMQTFKHLSNISHLHVNIVISCKKNQNLNKP